MKYSTKTLVLPFLALIPTASLADWNGAYVGLDFGALDAEANFPLSTVPEAPFTDSTSVSGFIGVQAQNGVIVYGGEAAFGFAPDAQVLDDQELRTYADIKGRVGYSFGDVLAYGIAGVSFVTYNETGFDPVIAESFDEDFNSVGFNVGAGVDYMVTDNIFVGAEYLARRTKGDYPNQIDDTGAEFDMDVDTFSVRVGFSF